MHRVAASVAALLALGVSACTAGPAVPQTASPGPPMPATQSSTATPGVLPSESAPPSSGGVATPAPSLVSPTSLEALLPDFAGGQSLTKQSMAGEEVLARSGDPIFRRLLELVGADPADISAVTASGGEVDLVAIRVLGVTGEELSAGMLAALRELDGSEISQLEVDGVPMQRVTLSGGDGTALLMRTAGDALVMASARRPAEEVARDALATLLDPGAETLLPPEVDGHALTRFSMPGEAIPATGDMCSMVCPGEPQGMAATLGVPLSDVDIAVAYSEEAGVSIVAFRFAGAATEALIPAREALTGAGARQATPVTVSGRQVIRSTGAVFGVSGDEEWQYAQDDVLYIVRAEPTDDGVPPIVEAVFGALP